MLLVKNILLSFIHIMSYISEKTELLKNRRFKGEQKPFLQNLVTNEVFASKDRAYITSELRPAG